MQDLELRDEKINGAAGLKQAMIGVLASMELKDLTMLALELGENAGPEIAKYFEKLGTVLTAQGVNLEDK